MAQTTVTRFCSKRCAERSYKDRMRQRKMALSNQETTQTNAVGKWKEKDYLIPTQAAELLGIGRMTIYRYIRSGKMKVMRVGRKTLISKADLHDMFGFLKPVPGTSDSSAEKKPKSLDDFYTRADIREKFGVKDSWIYKVVAENNVPKTIFRGRAYFSKSHIDRIFSAKKTDPAITDWYTVEDIQNKYGMTLSAIYCLMSKIGIPKKKENGRTFYSKYHFDVAKGTASAEDAEFISVADAMVKYSVTRDQLYHYVKTYYILMHNGVTSEGLDSIESWFRDPETVKAISSEVKLFERRRDEAALKTAQRYQLEEQIDSLNRLNNPKSHGK